MPPSPSSAATTATSADRSSATLNRRRLATGPSSTVTSSLSAPEARGSTRRPPAKFPSLRFFVDEDEELKQAFRMDIGQINDRATYLLDADGRVPPQVESAVLAVLA